MAASLGSGKRQPNVVSCRAASLRRKALSGLAVTSGARDMDSVAPGNEQVALPGRYGVAGRDHRGQL